MHKRWQNIEQLYQQIQNDLEQQGFSQGPLLDIQTQNELGEFWTLQLETQNWPQLTWALMIASFGRTLKLPSNWPLAMTLLASNIPYELIIKALGVLQMKYIPLWQREGSGIGPELSKALEILLDHPHQEVVTWCLRSIEAMGTQSHHFKQALQKKDHQLGFKYCFTIGHKGQQKRSQKKIIAQIFQSWRTPINP